MSAGNTDMGHINDPNKFCPVPTQSIYSNMDYHLSMGEHKGPIADSFDRFPWLLWYIWKARNDKHFRGIDRSPADINKIAIVEWEAWFKAQLDFRGPNMRDDSPQDPEGGVTSLTSICRIDGSWTSSKTFAGLGWSFYYDPEILSLCGTKRVVRPFSPLHTEIEAILWAMECLLLRGVRSIHIQTDSLEAVHILTQDDPWQSFRSHVTVFAHLKSRFTAVTLSKIPRTRNELADSLAHFSCHVVLYIM